MLVRLLYASRPIGESPCEALKDILHQSRSHNPDNGITGILCHSEHMYMQVLEGGRDRINALYAKILHDPRHTDVILLHYSEINERAYPGWIMGQANINKVNTSILLRFSELPELNPYAMSGNNALALIDDLMAAATIIKHS